MTDQNDLLYEFFIGHLVERMFQYDTTSEKRFVPFISNPILPLYSSHQLSNTLNKFANTSKTMKVTQNKCRSMTNRRIDGQNGT